MNSLIQIINQLQDVFAVVDLPCKSNLIDMPQIVVVGSQSSGKSSVLESLVGKSFLPRGTGIVTRAPLILQMIRYNDKMFKSMVEITKDDSIKIWACFLHKPNTIFHDFDKIKCEIENITDVYAGKGKRVTQKEIVLKFYTPMYDLTFVDLPGITKIPIGDQPHDIDKQIENMVLQYVEKPNSIILAVVTANTDPSTSESLQIARKVDPKGARTIAVVTKLDIIDEGTLQDTTDLLCGHKIPVKLGIIGVVNRSQKEIVNNKTLKETLKSEEEFLKTNYPNIYKKHGNKVLANTLQNILLVHIKQIYPILQKNLKENKTRLENELKTLNVPENDISFQTFIITLINEFSLSYCETIKGSQKRVSDTIIEGGAKIVQTIHDKFELLLKEIDPLFELCDEQINTVLLNTAGTRDNSFVNERALAILIDKQVQQLVEPSMLIVDFVCEEMFKVFDSVDQSILDTIARFPKLNVIIKNVLNEMLEETVLDIKGIIKTNIEIYRSSLHISDQNFMMNVAKESKELNDLYLTEHFKFIKHHGHYASNIANEDLYRRELESKKLILKNLMGSSFKDVDKQLGLSQQVLLHKTLVKCYFTYINNIMIDFVPKCIHHKMINLVLQTFSKRLHEIVLQHVINRPINEVFVEEESVVEDRQRIVMSLGAVNKALKIMMKVNRY